MLVNVYLFHFIFSRSKGKDATGKNAVKLLRIENPIFIIVF